ncbi:MAG TPA: amidohydrolase family protein [Actinophytocola sp.]|jgi:predicted amidohydrolase YtcJ|nr:amidohydrolase family protein [Actinophytocola sp.]
MHKPLLLRDVAIGLTGRRADVRVENGRVAAVEPAGTGSEGADVIDGRGGTVLPGLVDAHVHMLQWASVRQRVSVAAARSAAHAVELLVAAQGPPGDTGLLAGAHYRETFWRVPPHKDLLDRAFPARPVAVFSNDLHAVWLNSRALTLVGREHPTGVLVEADAMAVTAALPTPETAESDRWVLEATDAAAARGITAVADYEYADTAADWTRRLAVRAPSTRVRCVIPRFRLDHAIELGHRTGVELPGTDGLLTVGPLKVFLDGSLNTRTAFCHDPYPGDFPDDEYPGELLITEDALRELVERAAAHGISPALHAIGDGANRVALDVLAAAGVANARIEHAQLLNPGDVARFAELGITAGVQPAHAPDDRDVADRYWSGRTARAFAYADLLKAGTRLEFGSDAPVAPLDPWDGIASAVTRTDDDRPPWHPEQNLPLPAALAASAGGRTTVAVGDPADLVVTGRDLRDLPPDELRDMPIVATILGGRTTHAG